MKRCRHANSERIELLSANSIAAVRLMVEPEQTAFAWCRQCGSLHLASANRDNRGRWLRPAQSAAEGKGKGNGR